MSDEDNLFFGGMPTGPDVRALNERFPELKHGDAVAYEAIEEVIRVPYQSSRFETVLTAWRRSLQNDRGLVVRRPKGSRQMIILDDKQVLGAAYDGYKSAHRKIRRTGREVATVKPEDELTRSHADHVRRLLYETNQFMSRRQSQIATPKVVQLPRAPARAKKLDD